MFKPQRSLALGAVACLIASGVQASPLQIDFSADAGTQAGWEGLGGTADGPSKNGTFSGYTDLAAGDITVSLTGLEFNRTFTNGGSGVDFPGTDLDAMYGDMLFRNDDSTTVNVTITGLLAGTYTMTVHSLINTPSPGKFDLNVQDADSPAFSQSVVDDLVQGTGTASTFNPNVIEFDVLSNGTDPVILQMARGTEATSGGTTGGWFGYSGLEIEVVPEPSSLALLAMGGLMILRRSSSQVARRRRA